MRKGDILRMKKILLPLLALILMLAACGNGSNDKSSKEIVKRQHINKTQEKKLKYRKNLNVL